MPAALNYGEPLSVMIVTAAVMFAGLLNAGAGVLACSPTRQNDPVFVVAPQQEAPRPPVSASAAVAPVARNPTRPSGATRATDQGRLVIQAVVR